MQESPPSFIHDFVTYTQGTECPKPYVLWTAYGLLSAASAHRVWTEINIDNHFIRTDLYILLVGSSGGRKTASMLLGRDLLNEAIPNMVFAADNETYQGVIGTLSKEENTRTYLDPQGKEVKYSPYHIFAEELMDYLQLNPIAMVTFLTNIYGKKGYHYRLKNEENFIPNTFVTMCACSVPEWLTAQIQAKQFSEGYGRRTIIVCHDGIIRRKPEYTGDSKLAKLRCIARLQKIQGISGCAKMTPEADAFFWNWYTTLKDPDDKFLKNWYSTLHLNVLKVAMLSSLAERDDLVITINHIQLAMGLLEEIKVNLPMITSRIGRNEAMGANLEILRVLQNHSGQIPYQELLMLTIKDFRDTMEQFRAMQFLQATGQILVDHATTNGKVVKYVFLVPKK